MDNIIKAIDIAIAQHWAEANKKPTAVYLGCRQMESLRRLAGEFATYHAGKTDTKLTVSGCAVYEVKANDHFAVA